MDIESTIEDLEAQAYFASLRPRASTLTLEIELTRLNQPVWWLRLAMIGLDFVGGFAKVFPDRPSSWVLIPNHAIAASKITSGLAESGFLAESAADFIAGKLLDTRASIKTLHQTEITQGSITKVFGNQLEIRSSKIQLIPLESVQWLAVDSLSKEVII